MLPNGTEEEEKPEPGPAGVVQPPDAPAARLTPSVAITITKYTESAAHGEWAAAPMTATTISATA